jgi:hypothetical protein
MAAAQSLVEGRADIITVAKGTIKIELLLFHQHDLLPDNHI